MSLTPGSQLGSYEIQSLLGEGGMGQVYKARDGKLGREVAIKVLPASVANDPERLARFEREAKLLASLSHTNIAQIYGLEDAASAGKGGRFLVMELAPGQDLTLRIGHGPLDLHDALPIALQITHALEAAHDRGIVHRDLKPANIKVSDDGAVKVLDFGLAKAFASGRSGIGVGDELADTHRAGHRGRRHPRHGRLHEPRAGARTRGRQTRRRLGLWRRVLRDADGRTTVSG